MEHKLIELYLLICRLYDTQPVLKEQCLSNFKPAFTDEELLTMYLFGHLQGHTLQRRIYDYMLTHWHEWFPDLPSYQAFNRRLNELAPAFELIIERVLYRALATVNARDDRLIDSLPVMLAQAARSTTARQAARSTTARVAAPIADKGFCASKNAFYYGVKLHAVVVRRHAQLPIPQQLWLSRASQHDLSVLREVNPALGNCGLFGDKAFACQKTAAEFAARGIYLLTPTKANRGQPLVRGGEVLLSRFVSSVRQPLGSLFGWLIQRTDIHNASRVRSTNGLLIHCYGKLAVACLLLTLYS